MAMEARAWRQPARRMLRGQEQLPRTPRPPVMAAASKRADLRLEIAGWKEVTEKSLHLHDAAALRRGGEPRRAAEAPGAQRQGVDGIWNSDRVDGI